MDIDHFRRFDHMLKLKECQLVLKIDYPMEARFFWNQNYVKKIEEGQSIHQRHSSNELVILELGLRFKNWEILFSFPIRTSTDRLLNPRATGILNDEINLVVTPTLDYWFSSSSRHLVLFFQQSFAKAIFFSISTEGIFHLRLNLTIDGYLIDCYHK